MAKRVRPFLMFTGEAREAMDRYMALFPGGVVSELTLYKSGEPGPEGTVKTATFTVCGQEVRCSDSFVKHAFSFTPSFSFFVDCESEEELRRLSTALLEGGTQLMPAGDYGFSKLFAWVNDRYGVSWQFNLA